MEIDLRFVRFCYLFLEEVRQLQKSESWPVVMQRVYPVLIAPYYDKAQT